MIKNTLQHVKKKSSLKFCKDYFNVCDIIVCFNYCLVQFVYFKVDVGACPVLCENGFEGVFHVLKGYLIVAKVSMQ